MTWWADPIDDAVNAGQNSNVYLPRMFPAVFSARGLVPIGYAAFAFALGVAVGLVIRRTLVALAVTLAAVILVQVLAPTLIRPHLMAPTESYLTVSLDNLRGFMLQRRHPASTGEGDRGGQRFRRSAGSCPTRPWTRTATR